MPKGPIIQDPLKRRLAIALLMGTLLATSLIAAAWITGARLGL
ncbi:MAG: hypothetical protein ACPGYV_06860 [Phycisphaeraceae bacterium]